MIINPPTLAYLSFHWGYAYLLGYARDRWVAVRRDGKRFLAADTLAGLEHAINDDYRQRPVPRDFAPAGTAGYPGLLDGEPDDDLDTLDAEMLLAAELRKAFPLWTVGYSPQLGRLDRPG